MIESSNLKKSALLTLLLMATQVAMLRAAPVSWVERSNANSIVLLKAIASTKPEEVSSYGLKDYDNQVADLAPGVAARERANLQSATDRLKASFASETDPLVRSDLEILVQAAEMRMKGSALTERLLLDYVSVGRLIFYGEFYFLRDQMAEERRISALSRLKRYTGMEPGSVAATERAKVLFTESMKEPGRLGPYRGEVEKDLSDLESYASGIRKLFEKHKIPGAGPALDALDTQLKDYGAWVRANVLPRARADFRLPRELYAQNLREIGLGIPPEELIHKAELEYSETENELQAIAPLVARERGFADTDYRLVVRDLKREQLAPSEVEAYYHEVIAKIEGAIRRERIIALPERSLVMRLASEAETAAQPAPHYQPPPLIGNLGERGEFVLPLANSKAEADPNARYDDFSFKAASWTLSAHEGRPGHDLQFTGMLEQGVSLARSIFAFNSVNVEGWALYAEAEFKPYEPLDGQMIALQLRLLRAARAILDPMLNLGLISRERAHDILRNDVCLSEAFTTEELDRFTFRSPGQATAYFYGYSRLMELRASTEIALGPKFDRFAFNNFIVGQGLLPPDLLAAAVNSEFIPSQK
jgi:hypothetical protein